MFWTDNAETIPATMADSRSRLRFSPPELGRVDANIRAVRDRFAQCGHAGLSSIVVAEQANASTASISSAANVAAPVTRLDALLQGSERAGALDHDRLRARRCAPPRLLSDPILLYPKTETHWNELGAFYGYRAIMTALARSIPIDHPETLSLDRLRREVHIATRAATWPSACCSRRGGSTTTM